MIRLSFHLRDGVPEEHIEYAVRDCRTAENILVRSKRLRTVEKKKKKKKLLKSVFVLRNGVPEEHIAYVVGDYV